MALLQPTPTPRVKPVGEIPMEANHRIMLTHSAAPDLPLWEVSITPPGLEGGEAVDMTNQFAEKFRQKAARVLQELTDGKLTALYCPGTLRQLSDTIINVEGIITVSMPTDPRFGFAFPGYFKNAKPSDINEKNTEPPTIEIEVVATMRDPVFPHDEMDFYVGIV